MRRGCFGTVTHRIKRDGYKQTKRKDQEALFLRISSLSFFPSSNLQVFLQTFKIYLHDGGKSRWWSTTFKWDQGLFEQVVRGHQFVDEWDTQYPAQRQMAADAPPGYITLFAEFFGDGNFRLPTTHFLGNILQYYAFYISQLSPMGMVRIQHFMFVCWSQGEEPTGDKFRTFYQ
ncbi:hypothetical protein Hanom_Chr07g00611691 [Helianthus anomalus]